MEQEFEIRPERPRRRRLRLGCGLLLLLLLAAGSLWLISHFWPTAEQAVAPAPTGTPVATIPAATATAVASEETSAGDLPGRIAFVTANGQVGTVRANGEESRMLTAEERFYLFPAWSPDGSRLAAIGSNRQGAGVYLLPDEADAEAAGEYTILYDSEANAPIYLYWAPDGSQVSFIAQRGDSLGLYLAPADGSAASRLLLTGQPFYWDWAGGGERLLIHTGATGDDARLAFLDVEEQRSGENLASPGFFQTPSASQDGAYVAFASVDAAEARWVVVEAQARETVHRVPHRGAVALSWSPTANQVAFISPEFGERQLLLDYHGPLRLLDAESGEGRLLVEDQVLAFFWAPNGEQIAYFTLAGQDQRLEAAGSGRFTRHGKRTIQEDELRLEVWVVDVAQAQTTRIFTFSPTGLFVRQFLPFFDQYALSHRLWAPDSSALVLPVQEGRDEMIYVVPVDGLGPRPVAEGDVAFWSWQ